MVLCYKKYTQRCHFYGFNRKSDIADRRDSEFSSKAEKSESHEQVELGFGVPEKSQFNLVLDAKNLFATRTRITSTLRADSLTEYHAQIFYQKSSGK